jgi:hypothetical protein
MCFIKFHARPVKNEFAFMEVILLEIQPFFNQVNGMAAFKQRAVFKQLMRENDAYIIVF